MVGAGNDPLRTRRFTRELHGVLAGDEQLRGQGVTAELYTASPDREPGSKGTVENIVLLATAAATARPAFDALVTALQAWLQRPDRRATITMTHGDWSVTLAGEPTEQQLRAIREFRPDPNADDPDSNGARQQ
ncbi:hypothetical protein [Pseudonocardia sp. NPDC046786]|uniref:effector-associated constant component EACC1 n=1 Tax=Pseudonocardia sp. NPDC046786 TaxID=3155471 RepID=UPI003408674A